MPKQRSTQAPGSRRGFTQIVSGTLVGQVTTFLVLPILSRLYSREQFGALALLTSISALLAPVLLAGMDQAVVRPKSDATAKTMVQIGWLHLLVGSVVAGVVFYFLVANGVVGMEDASASILLPLCICVVGLSLLFTQLLVRQEKYASLGIRNTVQSLSITGFQLIFAFLGGAWGQHGLILGFVLGTFVGVATLFPSAVKYLGWEAPRELVSTFREQWRYPFVFGPSIAFTQFAQQFPLLFIAFWFGVESAGDLGMAERLVGVPTVIFGLAGASVFDGRLSKAMRDESEKASVIYTNFIKKLSLLGLVVFVGFAFIAPPLIPIFLGAEWTGTADVVRAMAAVACARMMITSLRGVFRILGAAKIAGGFEVFRALCLLLSAVAVITLGIPEKQSIYLIYAVVAALDFLLLFLGYLLARRQ